MPAQAEYAQHAQFERTWRTPSQFIFADGMPIALKYQRQAFGVETTADILPPYALFAEQGPDSGFTPDGFTL